MMTKYADSLILALAECVLFSVGHVCLYTERCELIALLSFGITAPLSVLAVCFAVRDLRRPALRWQAMLAMILAGTVFVLAGRMFAA